jgi:hypothetical protein
MAAERIPDGLDLVERRADGAREWRRVAEANARMGDWDAMTAHTLLSIAHSLEALVELERRRGGGA